MSLHWINIVLIAALNGSIVMIMEVLFPRIAMIWFGNMLHVWSAMLIASLLCFALGYYLGSKVKHYPEKRQHLLYTILLLLAGGTFFTLPFTGPLFGAFLSMDAGIACLIVSIVLMLPTITVFAMLSTKLVGMLDANEERQKLNSAVVFSVSTLTGVLAIILIGAYLIPYHGVRISAFCAGGMTLLSTGLFILASRHRQ